MFINGTMFGSITVDGRTYEHDIVIDRKGKIRKRRKKLSKSTYGTSHILSLEEAEDIYEKGVRKIIIGSGQKAMLRLSPEAETFFRKAECRIYILDTPGAVEKYNRIKDKKIGLFHVTC